MALVKLTETAINRAIREAVMAGRTDLSDVGLPGLRLRIVPPSRKTPTGAAGWVLACRDQHGRMRRFPLGAWPGIGIAEAREKARALRVAVRDGADPVAEARRKRMVARDAAQGIGTLAALLDLYGGPAKLPVPGEDKPAIKAIGPGRELRTWGKQRGGIESVFRRKLSRALAELTAPDLQLLADSYPARQQAAAAVRYIRPVLKWGAQRGYLPREVALIDPPATVQRRTRVLSHEELTALLPVLATGGNSYRRAMRFMLLTLVRREEAAGATWGQIDLAVAEWRIPQTKNGLDHRVPLSRRAVALLTEIGPGEPDALVFIGTPARGAPPGTPGGRLVNWDRATKEVQAESRTSGWHRHDLRRTGATLLGELGTEPHVIEAALNHVAIHSALAATYNRARYLPAVRIALQTLADRLDGLATGGAEVVPLRRPA